MRGFTPDYLFGEQRGEKGKEGAKGTPVTPGKQFSETEGEEDEHYHVDDHDKPRAIERLFRYPLSPPSSLLTCTFSR